MNEMNRVPLPWPSPSWEGAHTELRGPESPWTQSEWRAQQEGAAAEQPVMLHCWFSTRWREAKHTSHPALSCQSRISEYFTYFDLNQRAQKKARVSQAPWRPYSVVKHFSVILALICEKINSFHIFKTHLFKDLLRIMELRCQLIQDLVELKCFFNDFEISIHVAVTEEASCCCCDWHESSCYQHKQ